jgi:AraC family transcriptional regulator
LEWFNRMKAALDLIEERITEPLEIEDIAKAAYSSPFHFQRMFHMVTGMTTAEYVRKRRITLAAQELAMSEVKVMDVALKYSYDSPESFAKAFRRIHGISPSEARSPGVSLKATPRISFHLSLKGDKDMEYRIEDKEAFIAVGKVLVTTCAEGQNLREIPQFWQQCQQDGTDKRLVPLGIGKNVLGICMDMQTGSDKFNYMIGVQVNDAAAGIAEGFAVRQIPASTWAIFTSVGPMPGAIQDVFSRIYSEWFPSTGYEHAGTPELEVYPEGDPSSDDYRCEVWIPIVKR